MHCGVIVPHEKAWAQTRKLQESNVMQIHQVERRKIKNKNWICWKLSLIVCLAIVTLRLTAMIRSRTAAALHAVIIQLFIEGPQ